MDRYRIMGAMGCCDVEAVWRNKRPHMCERELCMGVELPRTRLDSECGVSVRCGSVL